MGMRQIGDLMAWQFAAAVFHGDGRAAPSPHAKPAAVGNG
jgi:hypothetical protein